MGDRIRRHAYAYLHLFKGFLVPQIDAGHDLRRRAVEAVAHGLHFLEVLGHQFNEAFVVQVSGSGDDYVSRSKALAVKVHHWSALETAHGVASSKNRPA